MKDTILIVDDSPLSNSVLKTIVNKMNLKAEICDDGNVALQRLGEVADRLAAVLLDLYMPRVDGFFVLRQIQKKLPNVPVVVISGSDLAEDKAKVLELGAREFIKKPFSIDVVQTAIESVLGQK